MTKDEAREILIAYKKWRHGGKQADSIWSNEIKSTEHFFEAIDCAIQALGDGWIDVDVVPSETNYYTVYYMNQMDSGYRIVFFNGSRWIDEYGHEITDITNYQPLPSPPKPKQP